MDGLCRNRSKSCGCVHEGRRRRATGARISPRRSSEVGLSVRRGGIRLISTIAETVPVSRWMKPGHPRSKQTWGVAFTRGRMGWLAGQRGTPVVAVVSVDLRATGGRGTSDCVWRNRRYPDRVHGRVRSLPGRLEARRVGSILRKAIRGCITLTSGASGLLALILKPDLYFPSAEPNSATDLLTHGCSGESRLREEGVQNRRLMRGRQCPCPLFLLSRRSN